MSVFSPIDSKACFALLDDQAYDHDASAAAPRSRLYTGYLRSLECPDGKALPALLDGLQEALLAGEHALVLLSYEAGADMHNIDLRQDTSVPSSACSKVLLFKDCAHLSAVQVEQWLAQCDPSSEPAGITQVHANVTQVEFTEAIDRIHGYIEAGDTYQVNYTYRLRFQGYGSAIGLYRRLRQRQPVPYGAFIMLPDGGAVLSLSPELFVRHAAGQLISQPMKGTAAASGDTQQDRVRANELASDPKNRAENLMIVDLLRNDLGRIAEIGSVQVPHLFEITRYTSVLQMTSTVNASLRNDVGMGEVIQALYPCGSITGAPKHRTMQIIRELESQPRGLYTGAIGWFDAAPEGKRIGDFCLSVPIRTLIFEAPDAEGLRSGEMGVGAGIVFDSDAEEEYKECQLKARFLTGLGHQFELFETMHATREQGCRHLERHLQRLRTSAARFDFVHDEEKIRRTLHDACSKLPTDTPHRLRLALDHHGYCSVQSAPLIPLTLPIKILLAPDKIEVAPLFLHHKTTVRAEYDRAWQAAEKQGAFDMLFCNRQGELTEGGRSNLFVKFDGIWITPALSCGVLPGVMRAVLLDDPAWQAQEGRLTLDDLRCAEQVIICNALRGPMPAEICW